MLLCTPGIQWDFTESHLHMWGNLCCYSLYSDLFSGGSFCPPPTTRAVVEGRVPCLHGLRAAKTSLPKRAALRQHLDAVKRGSQLYFQMFTANSLGLQKRNQTKKSPLNKQPTTVLILNQLRSTQLGCSKKDLFYSPTFFCIICQHTRTGGFLTYF